MSKKSISTRKRQRRQPLRAARGSVSYDDWQNAYEEAAGHVEYVAGTSQNQLPEGEREAMRLLAKRLRRNAARLTPNTKLTDGAGTKL